MRHPLVVFTTALIVLTAPLATHSRAEDAHHPEKAAKANASKASKATQQKSKPAAKPEKAKQSKNVPAQLKYDPGDRT